jgi:hypothetical protein
MHPLNSSFRRSAMLLFFRLGSNNKEFSERNFREFDSISDIVRCVVNGINQPTTIVHYFPALIFPRETCYKNHHGGYKNKNVQQY